MLCRSLDIHGLVLKQWFLAVATVVIVSQVTCGPDMVCGEILQRPQALQIIENGSGFTIKCTTSVSDRPVDWTCYGQCSALQSNRNHAYVVMSDDVQTAYSDRVSLIRLINGQKDLYFHFATESDSGNYSCKDNAGIGDQASGTVIVKASSTDDSHMTSRWPPKQQGVTSAPNRFNTSVYAHEDKGPKRTASSTGWTAIVIIICVLTFATGVAVGVAVLLYKRFRCDPRQSISSHPSDKLTPLKLQSLTSIAAEAAGLLGQSSAPLNEVQPCSILIEDQHIAEPQYAELAARPANGRVETKVERRNTTLQPNAVYAEIDHLVVDCQKQTTAL